MILGAPLFLLNLFFLNLISTMTEEASAYD